VDTYTIGQAAERSGFTASALRYYEGIGLLAPSNRTDGGYRIYDEHALARLGFIARAKRLGCSLEQITDLIGIWDGERCGAVQHRFHALVTDKISEAQSQIADLVALSAQLRTAAAQLERPAIDGPCDGRCACVTDQPPTAEAVAPGVLVTKPEDTPIACTLEAGALPDRLAEWRAVLDQARSRGTAADGALRIDFGDGLSLTELARLVDAEQHCCAFFSFAITVDHRGVALEVRAPDGAGAIVASLFGPSA